MIKEMLNSLEGLVDDKIESQVVKMAIDFPAYGQKRASNELRKEGIFLSPAGVRGIWLRHCLETFKKRLAALEKRIGRIKPELFNPSI